MKKVVIYRISDSGYNKVKPDYINNKNCLRNAIKAFPHWEWVVIADDVSEETMTMIMEEVHLMPQVSIKEVAVGHGAGTFNKALDLALEYDHNDIIYFLENDYIHRRGSSEAIIEAIDLGSDFVSLYDHPDKYLDPKKGGNPYCEGGAEDTRVYLTKSCWWKITNSTTMTFASKVSTLKKHESILREHTSGTHPNDFHMFIELRSLGALLVSPIPSFSTHGETAWLAPHFDWRTIV